MEWAQRTLALISPTDILPNLYTSKVKPTPIYASRNIYATKAGDSCDGLALAYNLLSTTFALGYHNITDCESIEPRIGICPSFFDNLFTHFNPTKPTPPLSQGTTSKMHLSAITIAGFFMRAGISRA
jgi:hypothetical protein